LLSEFIAPSAGAWQGAAKILAEGGVAGVQTAPLTCLPQSLFCCCYCYIFLLLYRLELCKQVSYVPTKKNQTKYYRKNSFHRQLLDCRKLVALVARFVVFLWHWIHAVWVSVFSVAKAA